MITTNTGAKKIEGTDNWREIFDAHNDSVTAHDKVSEAMTYVVNGNKSIENAAIPVGSYVRLANSTIVGRSDGIYTVKTAIPVNTVIDSSYFNENAPIPGGVANALNSKIILLEGTINSSGNSTIIQYPAGCSMNNVVIISAQWLYNNSDWRSGDGTYENIRFFVQLQSDYITIYNTSIEAKGRSYKILLYHIMI